MMKIIQCILVTFNINLTMLFLMFFLMLILMFFNVNFNVIFYFIKRSGVTICAATEIELKVSIYNRLYES